LNNCGVEIDEDGDEECVCCQPPHFWWDTSLNDCVCDNNGNTHSFTGMNGISVCCSEDENGYETSVGSYCCPKDGEIYRINLNDQGCCIPPNKVGMRACCSPEEIEVQNISSTTGKEDPALQAICCSSGASNAINGECCYGEVYLNGDGVYECCPIGKNVSNGACCSDGQVGVPNYNVNGNAGIITAMCCPEGTDKALNGSCCGCTNCNSDGKTCPEGNTKVTNHISSNLTCGYTCCPSGTYTYESEENCGSIYNPEACVYRYDGTQIISSIGAINGICCTSTSTEVNREYSSYGEVEYSVLASYSRPTYEILDGSAGLKCIKTSEAFHSLTIEGTLSEGVTTTDYNGNVSTSYTYRTCLFDFEKGEIKGCPPPEMFEQ